MSMFPSRPSCSGSTLDELLRMARLELAPERVAAVGPTVGDIYGLMDRLDAVELGEVVPATAFDARWE
ncbi:hypothetical protein SAMN05216207_10652 [Pseudonocardia ammonioxydans]|uniref:Uncharacterized protein n=2 Tax=Pseudonocardia ammonioxydans TaxID=260086 RepID=A0A1I5HGN1_PSUAM|nr:hypothetical protein SAMN05216207_10652 [Pseudonocardia ammonioxydans]